MREFLFELDGALTAFVLKKIAQLMQKVVQRSFLKRLLLAFEKTEQGIDGSFQSLRTARDQLGLGFETRHESILFGKIFGAGLDDVNRGAQLMNEAADH